MNKTKMSQVKAAVILAGSSYSEIARQVGVTPSCVSNVIAGRFRSRRVEDALIALGVPEDTFGPRRCPGRPIQS